MLVVDKSKGYPYNQLMNQVFLRRNILRQPVRPMVAINWTAFQADVVPSDEVFDDDPSQVMAVRNRKTELLPLPCHMLNVEAPGDTYYEFNGNGDCTDLITVSIEELVEHAHICVDFLKYHGLIRADKGTPFEIDENGNLIRSHFACGCGSSSNLPPCGCINNCQLKEQPEFGKCWKPENNAGCGCNQVKEPICIEATDTRIQRAKNIRVSGCGCMSSECRTSCPTFRFSSNASVRVKC
jgi:hypothetical protein